MLEEAVAQSMNFEIELLDSNAQAGDDETRPAATEYATGRKIKDTGSICPVCLEPVAAEVFERDREVWMDKACTRHGRFSSLLSSDIRHYYQPSGLASGSTSCCGSSCGAAPSSEGEASTPWTNHSCTVLIEITERCNLSCPTCFAGSSPTESHLMSMEEFEQQVDQLVAGGKQDSDMIQLSGGEPTIHPDFLAMVSLLFDRGFHHVTINSNGIKLAQPAFVEKLAACLKPYPEASLFAYLQFDGFDEGTHVALRGRDDLLPLKHKALENCHAAGISVHPVMTLTRGINDHEVGDFLRLAADDQALKNVVIQPAMYSGRYDNPRRQDRITLADTVELITDQFGVFTTDDFIPIPCSDPNCFGMAVALRTARGLLPVSRFFPRYEMWDSEEAQELIREFTDTINGPGAVREAVRWATGYSRFGEVLESLGEAQVDALLDALQEVQEAGGELWDRVLTVSIKPFMDAWTYDQDRIDGCCVHILDRAGNPVSFCEYNAVTRPRMNLA
jgi:uncharacterized radical SAM superfamily Fe-S cluster-containing enzyme